MLEFQCIMQSFLVYCFNELLICSKIFGSFSFVDKFIPRFICILQSRHFCFFANICAILHNDSAVARSVVFCAFDLFLLEL